MKESERYRDLIEMVIAKRPDGYFDLLDWLYQKYNDSKILEKSEERGNV